MASIIETLAVKLVGDVADFESKMNGANKTVDGFGSKMQAVGGQMTKWGTGLTAGVTAPIVGMGIKAVEAASDLNESMSKVDVVFGKSADQVQKWSQSSAKGFGQSRQQALEAVGTYGNLFTAMGLGTDKSAAMSEKLVELAGDLASFNNIDPTVALEKLRAGLTGETEPLKSLGVNMSAASIQAKAMQMGLVSASVDMGKVNIATDRLSIAQRAAAEALQKHGQGSLEYQRAALAVQTAQEGVEKAMAGSNVELTAAQKAQAAYAIILDQTKAAQGDFARTSDGLANSTRIVKAQLADATAQLGEQLLPYVLQAVQWFSNLISKFQALSPETQKWILIIAGVAAAIGPVLVVLGTLISSVGAIIGLFGALPGVAAAVGVAIAAIGGPITLVIGAIALLAAAWYNDWGGIREKTAEAWNAIKSAVSSGWEYVKNLVTTGLQALQSFITSAWNGIKGAWESAWNAIKSTTNSALDATRNAINSGINAIKSFFESAWNGIKSTVSSAWDGIKSTIIGAIDAIRNAVQSGMGAVQNIFTSIWNSIKSSIDNVLNSIKGAFNIDWGALGRGIIDGIVNGIRNGAQAIVDAAKGAAQAALDAAKAALGIKSPSKKAAEEVGLPFAQGVRIGAMKGLGALSADIAHSLNTAVSNISPRVNVAGAGIGGDVNISLTQNFNGNVDRQAVASGSQDGILSALRQAGLR